MAGDQARDELVVMVQAEKHIERGMAALRFDDGIASAPKLLSLEVHTCVASRGCQMWLAVL
eukprot:1431818-Amphidinium_carterae.1